MSPRARVRPARSQDLDRLAVLFSLLLDHHAGGRPRLAARSGSEDLLRASLASHLRDPSRCVLACAQGESLAGFCVAAVARRPPIFSQPECGQIEHLFVRPEVRRTGIGRALAEAACAWLRQRAVAWVEIQVSPENAEGQAFWRAIGFAPAMDVLDRPL